MRGTQPSLLRLFGGGVAEVGEGADAALVTCDAAAAGAAPPPLRDHRRDAAMAEDGAALGQGPAVPAEDPPAAASKPITARFCGRRDFMPNFVSSKRTPHRCPC